MCAYHPANTRCWNNAELMLGHRRRRWPSINPALFQRLVFAEYVERYELFHCDNRREYLRWPEVFRSLIGVYLRVCGIRDVIYRATILFWFSYYSLLVMNTFLLAVLCGAVLSGKPFNKTTLNIIKPLRPKLFQFEIIIYVSASSLCFIWIPIL